MIDCWSENSPLAWPWSMAACTALARPATLVATKASWQVVQAARSAAVGAVAHCWALPMPLVAFTMPLPAQATQFA